MSKTDMRILYLIFIFTIASFEVEAQVLISSDTIVWDSDYFIDTNAHETVQVASEFISNKKSTIQWLQNNGAYVMEFKIKSIQGNWNSPDQEGSIEYFVTYQEQRGTIRISKVGESIEVIFSFLENGQNTMPYNFHISRYNKK